MKTERFFKCDSCKNGTVKVIDTQYKKNETFKLEAKKCSSCRKFHGLKAITRLEEI